MPRRFPDFRPEHHNMIGHGVFHVIVMALLFGALVALAVWVITSVRRQNMLAPAAIQAPPDHAMGEARMRYARGELSRDQYTQIVADLGGAPPPAYYPAPATTPQPPAAEPPAPSE